MEKDFNIKDLLTTAMINGITDDDDDEGDEKNYLEISHNDFKKISNEYALLYNAIIIELSEVLLAIALGSCNYIYKYIDEEFKSNEIEYYRAINNNKYYKYNPFKGYMLKESEMMRKVLGIIMYEKKQNTDFEKSHYLIMKSYKHLWNDMKYYRNNLDKVFDLNEYMQKLAMSDKSSEYELQMSIPVILYLFKTTKLENISFNLFIDEGELDTIRIFISKLSVELPDIFKKFIENAKKLNVNPEEIPYLSFITDQIDRDKGRGIEKDELFREIRETMFAKQKNINYDYIKKEKFSIKADYLIDKLINEFFEKNKLEIMRLENIDPMKILQNPRLVPERLMELADKQHKSINSVDKKVERINSAYSRILYRLGLSSDSLEYHFNLTKSDINKITHIAKLTFLEIEDTVSFNRETKDLFFDSIIYFYILSQKIISTKDKYLKNMNDDYINNLERYEEKLKNKETQINTVEKELDSKRKSLEEKENEYLDRIKKLEERIAKLEKDNSKLIDENAEIKENKKELIALRDHFFELEQTETPTRMGVEEMKNKINDLDLTIAIVGGHPNWVKKIKEELPNIEYIPITKNINEDLIKGAQYIIINRDYNKHSVYRKIIESISDNCELLYMSNVTNTDMSIKNIYNNVFREK